MPLKTEHPLRLAILLESDRQLAAHEAIADALCRRGHAVHLAVQGETLKDRDGALARLGAAHLSLTAGSAPGRQDRWSSLLKDLHDQIDPPASLEAEGEDDDQAAIARRRASAASLTRLVWAALPADPEVSAYLAQLDLDLLVVTPRADPWSARVDYLLAARRLGAAVALATDEQGGATRLATLLATPTIPAGLGADPDAFIAALERSASAPPRPSPPSWLARPVLEAVLGLRGLKRFVEDRLGADVQQGLLIGLLRRAGGLVQDAYAGWIFPNVLQGLLALLPRRRDLLRDLLGEQLEADEMSRLGWVEDAIASARRGGAPILLGPWVGGVGHEVLYWIPMLRWFRKYYRIDKSRIVVISRGGVKSWYTGVIGHYLDVFDLVPNKRQEYRDDALRMISSNATPSPAGKIEKEIYNEAARSVGAERFNTLHPQVMFKLFKRRWNGLAGDTFLDRYTRVQSIQADVAAAEKRLGALPKDYVAVNFHFSDQLADTPQNRALVAQFISRLSQEIDVFLIEPCIDAGKGPMADVAGPRIHRLPEVIRPSEILAVQSGVIAGARALVGTFGGMTYVGQALGRTAIGVRSGDSVSEGANELAAARQDPEGGQIHVIALDQAQALIPALVGDRPDDAGAMLTAILATAALPAAPVGPLARTGLRARVGGRDG